MNPVLALDEVTRNKRLLDSFKKEDRVRQNGRHPGEWLVSSSQYTNVWYRTTETHCGCEWWQHRSQACRHMVRVSWEMHKLKKAAKQAVALAVA